MAHLKTANAMVTHPRVTGRGWDATCRVASSRASVGSLSDQAREILGGSLDPDKWLFSHCTIVASVDVEKVPGARIGKLKVGSSTVDRRYADYYIKPECSQFVNNNGDSWSREVLLASYPTFIGAQNFQEHVQVEEKSKGRILDAVARDIGDSVYIDILVATNRKHAQLVRDIESKVMGTLSMGCTTDFTICSQCGHYAVDLTDLCDHIKTQKLNTFLDENNKKRVIAELCGHVDHGETGGVQFIEASWVRTPAFTGAVIRDIIKATDATVSESEIRRLLSSPAPSWSTGAIAKAASVPASRVAFEFGDGEDEEEKAEGEGEGGEDKKAPPFKDLEEEVYKKVKDRVRSRLESEMREEEVAKATDGESSSWPNDTLNKEAAAHQESLLSDTLRTAREDAVLRTRAQYRATMGTLLRVASSETALVEAIAETNSTYGVVVSPHVYRAALKAGGINKYSSPKAFVSRCQRDLGREPSLAELRVVVRVGSLLSRWESNNNPSTST
jgi:hypothetical protein